MTFFKVRRETLQPAEAATATDAVIASDTDRDERCVMSVKDERLQQQSEKEASEHKSHGTVVAVNSHDFPGWKYDCKRSGIHWLTYHLRSK